MKNVYLLVISTILFGSGISCKVQKPLQNDTVAEKPEGRIINSVTFSCAGNKTVQALFLEDKVELTLSDGRQIQLPQTISASGARYANPDESFVFWNKGNTAFIEENQKITFKDCTVTSPDQAPT